MRYLTCQHIIFGSYRYYFTFNSKSQQTYRNTLTMSGYRNLHREQIESTAIWSVATSPLLLTKQQSPQQTQSAYRVWTASADGLVRAYHVQEKGMKDKDSLDASALSMTCTHVLLGSTQTYNKDEQDTETLTTALGCSQVSVTRNYAGDDTAAGDLVVASLEMAGRVRVWIFPENEDAKKTEQIQQQQLKASQEFTVDNATGTTLLLCPPKNWSNRNNDVMVAVGCLDGTIAIVATGIQTPQRMDAANPKEPTPAGTVLERLGSQGSALPLSMTSHPTAPVLAVGRDGQIDVLASTNHTQQQYRRHRLRLPGFDHHQEGSVIRAITYTPDGALLCAGNDGGMLAVWDVSSHNNTASPPLVHHIVQAHASWILDITALPDSRRFISCGADRKLHVWRLDQMYQPIHTFDSDQTVWTLAVRNEKSEKTTTATTTKQQPRLVAGTETGWLQILSLDG